jgi:hypothetical protein
MTNTSSGGLPQLDPITLKTQAIAIPRVQGRGVSGAHEVSTDSKHTFHAVILPGALGGSAKGACGQ